MHTQSHYSEHKQGKTAKYTNDNKEQAVFKHAPVVVGLEKEKRRERERESS
tara:strand:+ start:145 stop:297 length:153 start_codon:yes stop_codon:yes gene_type:complete